MTPKFFDGDDEIVFSKSFNIYDNTLRLEGIQGLNITFNFDEEDAKQKEKDITISGSGDNAVVTFSSKIRNTLGSGTTMKTELAEMDVNQMKNKLLFSVYASKIGDKSSGLNLDITFYLRKV